MRRTSTPLVALLAVTALAGCGTAALPTPEPTTTPSSTPEPTTVPTTVPTSGPTEAPTSLGSLPGSAFLRVSAIAEVDGEEVQLQLTFARATTAATSQTAFQDVLAACPNAIASQLDIYPGFAPVGVITSRLEVTGDWPDGMRFAVAPGGAIASIGEGPDVVPSTDQPGMFGCSVPIITGPRLSQFTSLLIGDPTLADRANLDAALAKGLYGFESDSGSAGEIRWRDCVIQLSSTAQRAATENAWVLPGEWGDGCLIGDGGTV